MNARALVAEFIGTFALIFVGILVIKHLGVAESGLIGIALAHGLVIACLASATAALSGGHLNPAVTVAMMATGRMKAGLGIGYIVAQLVAGLLGAVAAGMCLVGNAAPTIQAGTPAVERGLGVGNAILAEAIGTFLLVFVIFGTAVDRRAPKLGALFIGLAVTFNIFAIGPITGAAMNPARWFGPAVVGGTVGTNPLVYIAGPLLGALAAAFLYHVMMDDKPVLAPESEVRTN